MRMGLMLSALPLAMEAVCLGGGGSARRAMYGRGLAERALEEPAVVLRVARAILHEEAKQRRDCLAPVSPQRGQTFRRASEWRACATLT